MTLRALPRSSRRLGLLTLGVLALAGRVAADVTLPSIFSDHAVLQNAPAVPVWGTASPGEKVTVTLGGQSANTSAGPDGKWRVHLDLHAAGPGPFELTVQGNNRLTATDILVGEVWFCSGQSNMELPMTQVTDAPREIADSADPALRQFLVTKKFAPAPADNADGKWLVAGPGTTSQFSAVGYFFARRLRKELARPVGFINSTWGGTEIQAWTSAAALDRDPDLKAGKERAIAKRLAFDDYVPSYDAWTKKYGREDHPPADVAAFAAPGVDTASWKPVTLPAVLSDFGLPAAGAVWVRREITVTPEMANHGLDLFLGDARDLVQVYWNGKKIAASTPTTLEHRYGVPAAQMTVGPAVLAVRIYQPATGLGIAPGDTRFRYGGNTPLKGEWLAKTEYALPALPPAAAAEFPPRPALPLPSNRVASWLYNAMIAPLVPYGVRGFLWYQGEQNAGQAYQYRTALPALINDWRGRWGNPELPFFFCQLPNFNPIQPRPADSGWAELRESQTKTLALPNTAEAVLIDVGEEGNIHPRNKQEVGARLAGIALAKTYGKAVPFTGPTYDSSRVEGGKVRVRFTHTDGRLVARPLPATYQPLSNLPATRPLVRNSPGGDVEGFAVCGADHQWQWATAQIAGDEVVVWSDAVPAPVAVRYAWADNPVCNLVGGSGLPAGPFRTDDFPAITAKAKY